jgi:hypothetical protein
MADKSEAAAASGGGISFGGLLTVLFIGLKLTHYIDWSWLWVLSPLWIPLSIVLMVALVILIVAGVMLTVAAILDSLDRRR